MLLSSGFINYIKVLGNYKIKNIYWPLGFVISLTILLYNITFWWNKPSWTWGMVFLMCYMEHKLNDELDEEK